MCARLIGSVERKKGVLKRGSVNPLVSVSVAVAAPQGGWPRTLGGRGGEP